MSDLKISPEQFLEYQELTRLKRFIFQDGISSNLQKQTIGYGIVKNEASGVSYFKCGVDSSILKTILLQDGFAFDSSGNLIVGKDIYGIMIPTTGDWYWVKIKHRQSVLEEGVVSVSATGMVNGSGTKFTDVLRGVPNHPTKIRFYVSDGSSLAPLNGSVDHTVQEVVSDTVIRLNSLVNQSEIDLRYSVVGTFTPSSIQTPDQNEIYLYDSADVVLTLETVLNTPPPFGIGENENNTFWIARVSKDLSNVFTQDKRSRFWQTNDGFIFNKIDTISNKVIGIESVKFQGMYSTRTRNNVKIGWGLRTSDWSFNANTLELTLLSSIGGNVKNINQIQGQTRDFTGWRLYVQHTDVYCKVVSNVYPTSTSLRLLLDVADPDIFYVNNIVYLVPDVDEIQIQAVSTSGQSIEKEVFDFNIADAVGIVDLLVNNITYEYEFSYRYKNNFRYTPFYVLPDISLAGYNTQYYNEAQFDNNGDLVVSPVYTTYIEGEVTLNIATNAYSIIIGGLQTGELKGVNYTVISNSTPFRDIVVGYDKQYQVFENTAVTLSAVNYINIKTTDVDNNTVKTGATFWFHFRQSVVLGSFNVRVKQDASISNPNGTGVLLREFSKLDVESSSSESGLLLKFVFDGTNWALFRFADSTASPQVVTLTNSDLQNNWIQTPLSGIKTLKYKVDNFGYVELFGSVHLPANSWTGEVICDIVGIPFEANAGRLPINSNFLMGYGISEGESYLEVSNVSGNLRLQIIDFAGYLASINVVNGIDLVINGRYPYKNA